MTMTNLRISGFRACFVSWAVILGACSSASSNGNPGGQGGGGQAGSSTPAGTGGSVGSGGSIPSGSGGASATGGISGGGAYDAGHADVAVPGDSATGGTSGGDFLMPCQAYYNDWLAGGGCTACVQTAMSTLASCPAAPAGSPAGCTLANCEPKCGSTAASCGCIQACLGDCEAAVLAYYRCVNSKCASACGGVQDAGGSDVISSDVPVPTDTGVTGGLVTCEGTDLTQPSGEAIVGTVPGSAVLLDGTNWITLPKTANYVAATGFTWELWFMGTSLPTDETVGGNAAGMVGYSGQMLVTVADPQPCVDVYLGFGGTFAKANMLAFTVDGPATCNNRDTVPVVFRPTNGFQNQRWYHAAAVRNYDAGCAGLYLDGVLVASKTTTLAPIAGTGFAASIGRWTDGGYDSTHFKGTLDEVRIYSRALSAREIADHYNGGLGRPGVSSDPGLVAGYHLDEASGTSAADFGPAKLDGQYVNTPGHGSGIVPLP